VFESAASLVARGNQTDGEQSSGESGEPPEIKTLDEFKVHMPWNTP